MAMKHATTNEPGTDGKVKAECGRTVKAANATRNDDELLADPNACPKCVREIEWKRRDEERKAARLASAVTFPITYQGKTHGVTFYREREGETYRSGLVLSYRFATGSKLWPGEFLATHYDEAREAEYPARRHLRIRAERYAVAHLEIEGKTYHVVPTCLAYLNSNNQHPVGWADDYPWTAPGYEGRRPEIVDA